MNKKLLFASLIFLAGAGCTATTEIDTTAETGDVDVAPASDSAGTEAEGTEGVAVQLDLAGGTAVVIADDEGVEAEVAEVKSFTVDGSNFAFSPSNITVNEGDTVRLTLVNGEGFHDLVIDELDVATKQINSGETETVEFVASKKGTFEYYCSVGSHRTMGMVGTLTVE